jgi:hypothetical protein
MEGAETIMRIDEQKEQMTETDRTEKTDKKGV